MLELRYDSQQGLGDQAPEFLIGGNRIRKTSKALPPSVPVEKRGDELKVMVTKGVSGSVTVINEDDQMGSPALPFTG
jgi:hypothetical protein